jgi:hypothetical protein
LFDTSSSREREDWTSPIIPLAIRTPCSIASPAT